ncbi:MAG: hypothetical protein K2J23_04305 [Muribaculaceae bacterium]|nr:hypothetical protein [Muribaculaceae bacterium]MDE6866598.1 hypothetical protein [Muribaculaceae bacterium]
MAIQRSIFTRFLKALEVPHTVEYSEKAFHTMDFDSLYGLSHLLSTYGIENEAYQITDKEEISKLTPPYLAQLNPGNFVIVDSFSSDVISYDCAGEQHNISTSEFKDHWNGIVLLAFPNRDSREPEYGSHFISETINRWSWLGLTISGILVLAYFYISRGVYHSVWASIAIVFNCAGLFFSYLLVQKTLGIHTTTGDSVCNVLQKGGCDSILSMKVSKLFGVFSWSVVGFSYFGISLLTLLIFPHLWSALALFNICCLPYTVWSIWYQRFRAHHWCTLCVGVQSTLWLLFGAYTAGGFIKHLFPMRIDDWVLLAAYIASVLFLNKIVTVIKNLNLHATQHT